MTTTAVPMKAREFTCHKCHGTGQYLNFGECYACHGTGRVSGAVKFNFHGPEKCIGILRGVYADVRHNGDECDSSAHIFAAEAVWSLLIHGRVADVERICAEFAKIDRRTRIVRYAAASACAIEKWERMTGDAQRLALRLAGYDAPTIHDKRGRIVPCAEFTFNP